MYYLHGIRALYGSHLSFDQMAESSNTSALNTATTTISSTSAPNSATISISFSIPNINHVAPKIILEGPNYMAWVYQFRPILRMNNLMGIVDGIESKCLTR